MIMRPVVMPISGLCLPVQDKVAGSAERWRISYLSSGRNE